MKLFLPALAATFLSACASAPQAPRHVDHAGPDRVCIEVSNWPNMVRVFTTGEAHLWLKQIDGLASPSESRACVAPGQHTIEVLAHNRYAYASAQIEVDAKSGQPLRIVANREASGFVFRVLDAGADPPSELVRVDRPVERTATPSPVYLPVTPPPARP
ncbi:hypothetical protein [Piscinibacter sakaiensis]|uniref:Lipoprotein n=2 Tax=Piscinibacter sakaiensis TaxID=1547922 RepID=A0A0K8NXJ0_PISS1|nr:hypothetical protein [Piscinibacter sakaiensis]GAP35096.1 hypothetical protein ISF6_0661 [Piscinibacter sakaiensis]